MDAVGIIAEYNPFHNGHKTHLDQARRETGHQYVIAVMSGNFVQRGEPAIFDKWIRAEMAVRAGVDLVLELPAVFAVRSAQYFAEGSIRLLNALGVVDSVCFGAETPDINALALAATVDDQAIRDTLKEGLRQGIPYAAAIGQAIEKASGLSSAQLASPNNILAIEYIRSIKKFAPDLIPLPIQRRLAAYHDRNINSSIASATAIRTQILKEGLINDLVRQTVPKTSANLMNRAIADGLGPVDWQGLNNILLYKLRTTDLNCLEQLPEISEGLHYKLRDMAMQATTAEELVQLIKSKRYTWTRIQRLLVHTLLETNKEFLAECDQAGPLYARVLAFNNVGRYLLRHISRYGSIPIIIKTAAYLKSKQRHHPGLTLLQRMLAVDTLASELYILALGQSQNKVGGWDFRRPPIYVAQPSQ